MQIAAGFKRFRQWLNGSTQRRLLIWSLVFWVIAVSILTVAFTVIGQNQLIKETRERNVQLASVISREVNSQLNSIFESTRVFSQHLEMLSPDLEAQAGAMLGLRLSTPRYRALYYFDSRGNPLLELTDTMQNLLAMKDANGIVTRELTPLNAEVLNTFRNVKGESS
jgi:hypothetical protein